MQRGQVACVGPATAWPIAAPAQRATYRRGHRPAAACGRRSRESGRRGCTTRSRRAASAPLRTAAAGLRAKRTSPGTACPFRPAVANESARRRSCGKRRGGRGVPARTWAYLGVDRFQKVQGVRHPRDQLLVGGPRCRRLNVVQRPLLRLVQVGEPPCSRATERAETPETRCVQSTIPWHAGRGAAVRTAEQRANVVPRGGRMEVRPDAPWPPGRRPGIRATSRSAWRHGGLGRGDTHEHPIRVRRPFTQGVAVDVVAAVRRERHKHWRCGGGVSMRQSRPSGRRCCSAAHRYVGYSWP